MIQYYNVVCACTVLVCLYSADITGQQISVTLTSMGDQRDLQVTVAVVNFVL